MTKKKHKAKDKRPRQVWPGMSRKRMDEIGAWLRETADKVGLRDWYFELKHVPLAESDDCGATIVCLPGRKVAYVRLRHDFPTWKREDQRATLLHELLHVHLDPISKATNEDSIVAALLGKPAAAQHSAEVHWCIEHAVDAIAYEMAKHFRLP